jgi:hypothetical protein
MIKPVTLTMVLGGLLLVLSSGVPVRAETDADEARLEKAQKSIDQDTAAKGQATQVQTLAKEFKVAPSVVEGLRANKQGWGETTIELSMAQRLSQSDPKTYPTLVDALNKIEALRIDKMGWGKISQTLGFKLGPVVSSVERAQHNLDTKSPASERSRNTEGAERLGRPERVERPERLERMR